MYFEPTAYDVNFLITNFFKSKKINPILITIQTQKA